MQQFNPHIFSDDLSVPDETVIYYAKGKSLIQNIAMVIGFFIGVYLVILNDNNEGIYGFILCGLTAGFLYFNYKLEHNKQPQIIINDNGIQTATTDFKSWKDIQRERVEYAGRSANYLNYDFGYEREHFFISNLDIKNEELDKLLLIYRNRYNKAQDELIINPVPPSTNPHITI